MKLFVFSVRDSKADNFGAPFVLASIGVAIRQFSDEVNRSAADNLLYMHPSDFELFTLGEFDSSTGLFDTGVPKSVILAASVKSREDGVS